MRKLDEPYDDLNPISNRRAAVFWITCGSILTALLGWAVYAAVMGV